MARWGVPIFQHHVLSIKNHLCFMADIQIIDYLCETHGTFTYSSKPPNKRETTIEMLSIFLTCTYIS